MQQLSRLDLEGEDLPLDVQLRVTQTTQLDDPETTTAQVIVQGEKLMTGIHAGYKADNLFSKIINDLAQYPKFQMDNGLLYLKKDDGKKLLLCIPRTIYDNSRIMERIIAQGHLTLGHLGEAKTNRYLSQSYWWPTLAKDVLAYCQLCGHCQASKDSTQKPRGLLHSLLIPNHPWDSIGMDFIGPLPTSPSGHDFIWVIIC